MQEISSSFCADIIEIDGALIAGMRGLARRWSLFVSSGLSNLLGCTKDARCSFFSASLESKREVAILYFGRASEFLLMTSERMAISSEASTLEQLLNSLRERGGRWPYELDGSHVVCTVNGKAACMQDTIKPGAEINIFSKKSVFEI
jgi:molybdopterin converting factor small subunit